MAEKKVEAEKILAFKPIELPFTFTTRDSIIYSLGIGFSQDQLNEKELPFTYELNDDFRAFPTFSTAFHVGCFLDVFEKIEGLPSFNPMMLLHGEQRVEFVQPLKPNVKYITKAKIGNIADKGKGALLSLDFSTYEVEGGKETLTCINTSSVFIRGLGGFGYKGKPTKALPNKPTKAPCKTIDLKTEKSQALLYRLAGDPNPLHADPNMAAMGGFDKPILHGLCFYGMAAKAVCQSFCDYDTNKLKAVQARFTSHVFPGETVRYSMWKEGNVVIVSGATVERGLECLVGIVELNEEPKPKL